jgi:SAM-dependent methyltransferase
VLKYSKIARAHHAGSALPLGPVVCMGVRSGKEVDLFRVGLGKNILLQKALVVSEKLKISNGVSVRLLESLPRRSDLNNIKDDSVVGVEVNPQAKRSDIFINSFDTLPDEWTGRFGILFSNSFDHALSAEDTAREWLRVVRPGGLIILLWSDAEPTETDPLKLNGEILCSLFGGKKLNVPQSKSAFGYQELFLERST